MSSQPGAQRHSGAHVHPRPREEKHLSRAELNEPMKFVVTPKRIGRFEDVDPWEIALGTHRSTADIIARRIFKVVRQYLVSSYVTVQVDLKKGKWTINHGRYGEGFVEQIELD